MTILNSVKATPRHSVGAFYPLICIELIGRSVGLRVWVRVTTRGGDYAIKAKLNKEVEDMAAQYGANQQGSVPASPKTCV